MNILCVYLFAGTLTLAHGEVLYDDVTHIAAKHCDEPFATAEPWRPRIDRPEGEKDLRAWTEGGYWFIERVCGEKVIASVMGAERDSLRVPVYLTPCPNDKSGTP